MGTSFGNDHDDDYNKDHESPHRFIVPRTNGREREVVLSEMEEVDKNQEVFLDY